MALVACRECSGEISTKAEKCPRCGAPQKKKTSLFTWLVTSILAFHVFYLAGNPGTGTTSTASSKHEPSPKQIAMENVKLNFSWGKAGFDSIMEANFILKNNSEYPVKDIEITFSHYAKSGTRIDSNKRTIYNVVPARSKKIFENFNMGFIHSQAEKTSCEITDLKA
jgi:hypothetical protein